jgi:hypothetical protein
LVSDIATGVDVELRNDVLRDICASDYAPPENLVCRLLARRYSL